MRGRTHESVRREIDSAMSRSTEVAHNLSQTLERLRVVLDQIAQEDARDA